MPAQRSANTSMLSKSQSGNCQCKNKHYCMTALSTTCLMAKFYVLSLKACQFPIIYMISIKQSSDMWTHKWGLSLLVLSMLHISMSMDLRKINTFKYHLFAPMGSCLVQIPTQWCHRRTKRTQYTNFSDLNSKISSLGQATNKNSKFKKPTITIIRYLNSNCQLPKPGDWSNFNTHKTFWKGLQDRNNNCLMEGRWKIKEN